MTGTEWRERMVRQARSWIGRREADGTHRVIIDVYNSIVPLPRGYRMRYTDPWCAAFVSAVAQVWGLTGIVFPECACDPMIALYKAAGRWMEDDGYVPRPGDLIFYDWQDTGVGDNSGSADHVGLVAEVEGRRIRLIEGNCGDAVCYQVREIDGLYIRGYGLPDYASLADGEDAAEPDAEPEQPAGCSVELPQLQLGDKGSCVQAAQALLILRGCGVGADGADGDFGPNTRAAVLRFQAKKGLDRDGIVGPVTWSALLRG
ncbi:MAG: peptidoglycan-binding protein [Oscillospiraceae bacterium]|nr:peptidoglycan-binding protein [Oscillospiraceae bacterium]